MLLIDEVDRADEEFEAFLLEILSDFAVTIPEIGTVRADRPPRVILTSNRTREVHDALKRRCLYHWIDYPDPDRELAILRARLPQVPERLAREIVAFVQRLREADLTDPGAGRRASTGPPRCWPWERTTSTPIVWIRRWACCSNIRKIWERCGAEGSGEC